MARSNFSILFAAFPSYSARIAIDRSDNRTYFPIVDDWCDLRSKLNSSHLCLPSDDLVRQQAVSFEKKVFFW